MTDKKIGLLPLARSTFDVALSEQYLNHMLAVLERAGHALAGPRKLLMDQDATRAAIAELKESVPDQILVLQISFTDAAAMVEIASAFDVPLSIWAVPEARTGGKLRLNSFCGLNLAAHALGLNGREFGYLYADPQGPGIEEAIKDLLAGKRHGVPIAPRPPKASDPAGRAAARSLRGARIGRLGAHPDGFDTCRYDKARLKALADVTVDELEIGELFECARDESAETPARLRDQVVGTLTGLDEVDQEQLDRSLRLKGALDRIRSAGTYDAFAVRCWPETFTEYGGAVCGPVAMMGEAKAPCACEADVYGALTSLLLQKVAGTPAFLTDLVDLDEADNTGVVWHCGQAPLSMADPDVRPRAAIHNNRRMPLLYEFPLKPGRVTFFRLSQAKGRPMAVIGGGEMLKRPLAFNGTSGVVRFDSGSRTVLERIMGAALEHHMALAYGDHRAALEGAAAELGLPVFIL
ncbi:MAG: L-fucose/L-arabinose isomerase family protein [Rhizobiaceae bacterium]